MSPENPNSQGRSPIGERPDAGYATWNLLAAASMKGTLEPAKPWEDSTMPVFNSYVSGKEQFPATD